MPPVAFNTGGGCTGIAIGDLDGDGKPDLALANVYNKTISVLRNTATNGSITAGSFAPKVDFPGGTNPILIVIADLDGDGRPDLVEYNFSSSIFNISIFRNTSTAGSLSFAPRIDIAAGDALTGLAIGDLDGDGKLDIAASKITGGVSIWRNTSSPGSITAGSFAVRFDLAYSNDTPANTSSTGIAIGDLDGDKKPEIIVGNNPDNSVAVWHNTATSGSIGNTSFGAEVKFATGRSPIDVAIGDLDGDGKPDLAVINLDDQSVSVLRNTSVTGSISASSFAPKVDFPIGPSPIGIAIGDLDGDGKPDLAFANAVTGAGSASVLRNTSSVGSITASSFAARVAFPTGNYTPRVAIGDLDGDGKPDLAVTNNNSLPTGNSVFVFRNNPVFPPNNPATNIVFSGTATNATTATWTNGSGTARGVFISAASTGGPSPVNNTSYAGNPLYRSGAQIGSTGWYCLYNGTGNTVNISGLSSGATYRVMVVEYTGSPGAENYLTSAAAGNPANVTTLASGNQPPIITSFSPSSGLIGTSVTITGLNFASVAANDIVFFGATQAKVTAASATSLTVTVPAGATYQPITVLNGVTALTGYSDQPFVTTFTPNKGNITTADFMPPVQFTTGKYPGLIAIGDLDGDGKPDLVISNTADNTVSVLRNISISGSITSGSFAPKVDFLTGKGPSAVAIADIDGDGKSDIIVTNSLENSFSILRNTSTVGLIITGSFASKVDFATDPVPAYVKVSDLDGDGKPDIVISIQASPDMLSIFRNTSTVGSITPNSLASAVNLPIRLHNNDAGEFAIGDLDGDGKPDIVAATFEDLAVAVFRNTSTPGAIDNVNSFAAPIYFSTAFLPYSVAIGDLDGDGKPDLAVSCNQSGSISVLKNISAAGSISFATHIDYPAIGDIGQIKIGDLDGDGKPDLAVVTLKQSNGREEVGTISLYRNTSTAGSIKLRFVCPEGRFRPGYRC
ncbi:MAG TPA: FG-GAP-like repeat-containing protein [Mucilaginibacter sp.]|nr:FG-GAP-like repeat-containing protein [Mucilaginibacter sp.]